MSGSAARPSAADIDAAAARIRGRVCRTPLVRSAWLSSLTGGNVWLKLEIVQDTGSFKLRGAANALQRLRERTAGPITVTTASAGNHGLAVAAAGRALGLDVRVHLPRTAPAAKREAIARYGADVRLAASYDEAERLAAEDARATGAAFVSAYSHPDVIAGAGTVGLEMLEDVPALDAFLVPLGGGGLLSGIAIAVRARTTRALIVGAEAAASPVFTAALAAGRPVTVDVADTLADGLAGNMEPDSPTFGIVRDLVDRVVRVPEDLIARAMEGLARDERLIVEGAGAVAVGALLAGDLPVAGRTVGVVLSGRNVDIETRADAAGAPVTYRVRAGRISTLLGRLPER